MMKNIIYILLTCFISICFSSCEINQNDSKARKNAIEEKKNIECTSTPSEYVPSIYKFNYENHEYIMFMINGGSRSAMMGAVHSPDCKCTKNQ